MSSAATSNTPYDQVPYKSFPFRQSHPDRLATIATLHGLNPKPIESSRILEIGCAAGGNLLPIADRYPSSQCVGIDLSSRQIESGQAMCDTAELKNVKLMAGDIRKMPRDLGPFDYIIAHGVYSWIPDDAQEAILQCCRNQLSPDGIAYISYNTNPGWRMRGMIRDLMAYHSRNVENFEDRVRKARAILHFLAATVPTADNPYGLLLRQELKGLQDKEDYYLLHEHLEEFNEPIYFWEFMDRARQNALQYVGEADFSAMSIENFAPDVIAVLRNLAADIIETEQYMDFVRNRMFRQTILCSDQHQVDRSMLASRLTKLHFASSSQPEERVEDLHDNKVVTFRFGKSVTKTTSPVIKAALMYLGSVWPRFVPYSELFAAARSKVAGKASLVDAETEVGESDLFVSTMLRCYASDQIELSRFPTPFSSAVADAPLATLLTRAMAKGGTSVTNARHETVRINDIQRRVLRLLDGRHQLPQVVAEIVFAIERGEVRVHHDGEPVKDPKRLESLAADVVHEVVEQLARQLLLC